MTGWRGVAPVLLRGLGLVAGAIVLTQVAGAYGETINWQIAVLYGTVLGIAMRWPIIMPSTGARVILMTGVVFDAIWKDGILTAGALILVEFGVRLLVLPTAYRLWEWFRPLIVFLAYGTAYGLSLLVGDGSNSVMGLHLDSAAFVLAYLAWILLNLIWSIMKAPSRGRSLHAEMMIVLRQTWWVPLSFLMVAWSMALIRNTGYPAEIPLAMALLLLQSVIGGVFTTMHQDQAISSMIRLAPWQTTAQRSLAQRVMRMAHALGRTLRLPADELRTIGYAAILQDALIQSDTTMPLWVPFRPSAEQEAMLRRYTEATVKAIETDGVLQDVASLIRFRYSAYDGRGVPAVAGDEMPLGAQVLTAANAATYLTSPEGLGLSPEQAVAWIQTHIAGRFQRDVLNALLSTLSEMGSAPANSGGVPETIRQLQGLVDNSDPNSTFRLGLRRAWMQLRSRAGLVRELPDEVQAVARLSTILSTSKDAEETARVFTRVVGQLFGAKAALALPDQPRDDLRMHFRATHEFRHMVLEGRQIVVQGGYMSRALLSQEPTQLVDLREASSPLAQEIARLEGVRSVLFVPLVSQGHPVGLLMVGLPRHHWFTPREVGLVQLMSDLAATALEKARLMAEAEERLGHISALKTFTDTLLDNLTAGIIVVDPKGHLTLANASAHLLFDELPEVGERLPASLRTLFPIDRALAGESGGETDLRWHSWVLSIQVAPLRDPAGSLLGAICLVRDVTQVRSMEERVHRVERLAAIAELAAGAAHEIRNPLTAIRGFIQLVQARGREEQGEYYQIILNEIDRIDAIIHDLLLLARPSRMNRVPTDVPAIVDEVLMLNQTELERQSIRVEHRLEPLGPTLLDPNMLRQLVLNFLINAVQAMPFGGQLTISLRRVDSEHVMMEFADTGVGIPPENLKRLFDPFFTTKEEGTGLGLALCHSIVQAHGGHIEVESQVGVGTRFTVTLVAAQEREAGHGA